MTYCVYLHIPKTAGTALKQLSEGNPDFIKVSPSHQTVLKDFTNVIFGVRDPWQRFCSGFWEIKTLDLRHMLLMKDEEFFQKYHLEHLQLKSSWPKWYTDLIDSCDTPDNFCTTLKRSREIIDRLYNFDNDFLYKRHLPLGLATQSLTWWLGDITMFKANEHRVQKAVDIKSLSKFVKQYYFVDMPTDPVIARTREQFPFEQSYSISDENLDWFQNSFRHKDYELINYIRSQTYYYK